MGGTINIFKINHGSDPREVLNWRLWLAVFSFGIMGAARGANCFPMPMPISYILIQHIGVDEGLISGTLAKTHFRKLLGLDIMEEEDPRGFADVKANISAMVQIGSVAGAGLYVLYISTCGYPLTLYRAFILCDRIGRLWATRQLCTLWILGIVIFLSNNGRLGQVYAGRFIAGLGIGQTTVIAPVYLSEIAPKSIRGLCTCCFAGSVYIGIMLAYFASWGAELHIDKTSSNSWVVPSTTHTFLVLSIAKLI